MSDMNKFNTQNYQPVPGVFNVNTSHPLIPNSQEYLYYKKYVSIHSEDRDSLKYPNSNQFEIEMPEDMVNVSTIRLANWTFPSNYNTFSLLNLNITMSFKINEPYNPGANGYGDPLANEIFQCLFLSYDENFFINIEEGFYNPQQMVTELTNKFNEAVTNRIATYLSDNGFTTLLTQFNSLGGYTNFTIVYNAVSQRIWFGNNADGFVLTNETSLNIATNIADVFCGIKGQLPDFSNWGLPGNLGLSRCNTQSITKDNCTPRFYYGDVNNGDNGYWLVPNPSLPNAQVYWIECPLKINFMGPSNIYMEIEGQNCIDETSPYNISSFTLHTNKTNGVYNSSFAKIPIPTTPISQWFDRDSLPYKIYLPPAERIRKLKLKFRYHNGQLVDFGSFDFSFTLEFVLFVPQKLNSLKLFGINL